MKRIIIEETLSVSPKLCEAEQQQLICKPVCDVITTWNYKFDVH